MIWGTWVQFPQIYLMPKYPNAAITWPTDSFYIKIKVWLDVKCGAENFILISVYSCFYIVMKLFYFIFFMIWMNVNNWAKLLSYENI